MVRDKQIFAVVYPFLRAHAERIFDGKDVIVKYTPRMNVAYGLGTKLLIYVSHSQKSIVGEATIRGIEFLPPQEAFNRYQKRLFLTKDEFDQYSDLQPNRPSKKPVLALTLSKPVKFRESIKIPFSPTMAGRYMSKRVYQSIFAPARE